MGPLGNQKTGATNVRYLILVLACMTSWFLYLHRYTWSIVAAQLSTEYGYSNTETGIMYSWFSMAYGIGQIPGGMLSDFFGPHLLLTGAIAGWSIAIIGLTLGGAPLLLKGSMVAFGATQSVTYPNLSKVTKSWFPRSTRTIIQALVATVFGRGGGAMSSLIMVTLLMGSCGLSWRLSLIIMALTGVVFAIVFVTFFRNSPSSDSRVSNAEATIIYEGEKPAPETRNVFPWNRAARNFSFHLFLFQQFFNAGADVFYNTYVGLYFLSRNIDLTEAGILISLPLFGGMAGGILAGFLNDFLIRVTGSRRWGRRIVGFSGKLLAFCMMFVAIAQSEPRYAGLAMFAVKFFTDWTQPTVWGTCTDLGGRYSATLFGILNTSGTVGGIFCAPFFGWVLDRNTTITGEGADAARNVDFGPLLTIVSFMYVACAVMWLFIDCTKSLDAGDDGASEG